VSYFAKYGAVYSGCCWLLALYIAVQISIMLANENILAKYFRLPIEKSKMGAKSAIAFELSTVRIPKC
jgi:hypothetical protein